MNRIFIRSLLIALFSVSVMFSLGLAEEITITTFYPSPFGSYNELETKRLAVGFTPGSPTFWDNFITVKAAHGNIIGIGGDASGDDLEIRVDDSTGPTQNLLSFYNSARGYYLNLKSNAMYAGNSTGEFQVVAEPTTFKKNDGTPTYIRVGEVWFCASY